MKSRSTKLPCFELLLILANIAPRLPQHLQGFEQILIKKTALGRGKNFGTFWMFTRFLQVVIKFVSLIKVFLKVAQARGELGIFFSFCSFSRSQAAP